VKPAVLPSAVLLAGLLLAAPARGGDNTCATAGCHESLVKGKSVHAAADSCDACHDAVSTPHPSKGKKTFKLTAQQPELCSTCHEAFKKAFVHSPVKDGTCTTCHDPHASKQAKLLTAAPGELCGTCHGDHLEFKVVHGPVAAGDCMACHTPHESAEKGLLLKKGDTVCFDCHVDVQAGLKKKVVHAAIEGGCTSCHNPHGAANAKLLADSLPGVCFTCHDGIADKVRKAPVVHAAVKGEKSCVACHAPHAGDVSKLLLKPEKDLCLGCHTALITKAMTTLHGPVATGECTACHDAHGGENRKLLLKPFPGEPYVAYSATEYALCFGCHNRDLLLYPDTSFATGFRDGERNLHYLHVNKVKGRSCRMCHAIHGADNASLIADKVPFGQWTLPLKYVRSPVGGSCSPGCHKTYSYERKSSGKKAGPPAPPPAKTK
jgi:predicted CXXCH cytochrome family protein